MITKNRKCHDFYSLLTEKKNTFTYEENSIIALRRSKLNKCYGEMTVCSDQFEFVERGYSLCTIRTNEIESGVRRPPAGQPRAARTLLDYNSIHTSR